VGKTTELWLKKKKKKKLFFFQVGEGKGVLKFFREKIPLLGEFPGVFWLFTD